MINSEITEKIYTLSEKYDLTSDTDEITNIEAELKKLLEPYKDGSIGIAQIDPIAGEIVYNSKKVVK